MAVMGDGGLLLQDWRDVPTAYVCAKDTGLLRQALDTAFRTDAPTLCNGGRKL